MMKAHTRGGGRVEPLESGWRLWLPPGPGTQYRLAQLDDYHGLPRSAFPHRPPFALQVRLRASQPLIPGTWGVGLWNDPFQVGITGPEDRFRLPTLPNAAWFFFASPPNYLTFHDGLPAEGGLAGTFSAPSWPWPLRLLAAACLPLAWVPGLRTWMRRLAGRLIGQDAVSLLFSPTDWHLLGLEWEEQQVRFWVDGRLVLTTACAPRPPLGLVVWVDNQYAAWRPASAPCFGTLAADCPVWVEVNNLKVASTLAKGVGLCYNSPRTGA